MNFSFTEDQNELRQYTKEFLSAALPATRVGELADSEQGYDPQLWRDLHSMGWFDADLSPLDRAVLIEEAGYALLASPWFTATALVRPLIANDDPLAARIDDGAGVTLAWMEDGTWPRLSEAGASRTSVDTLGRLRGRKIFVPDAAWCETVVVVADDGGSPALFEVAVTDADLVVQQTVDQTRSMGTLTLNNTPTRRIATRDDHLDLVALEAAFLAATSCEAVGVARRALDIAVDHARQREQFGRLIGTYQGVSHRLADVFKNLELARSLAYRAAASVENGSSTEPEHYKICLAAKATAGETAVYAAESAIQVLGGIGMTWDHPIHRWLKRAMLLEAWGGDSYTQYLQIADALLEPEIA